MRSALLVAVALSAACKGEPFRPDAQIDGSPDAYKPPWFYPAPGEVKNWDIQLAAPYDFATARAMMVVDLWAVVPSATTITYDDASTVSVPAGVQPAAIATLKAANTTVICQVGTGAMKLTDPDAMKFPGYEANPPNRPTPVPTNSSIGWSTTLTDANERFVDFRIAGAAAVLKKRIAFAKQIGCDGILAYRNDAASFIAPDPVTHGFSEITSMEETDWIVAVAKAGHDLMISVGGRGGHGAPNVGEINNDYDWLMAERCAEVGDCDLARPFTSVYRAVFGLDYDLQDDGTTPNSLTGVCQEWANNMVDGVMKTANLDGGFRMVCP